MKDIGLNGGVFRATDRLYEIFGPKRVMDTPLAESGIVGFSIGLAIGGFIPIAEIQFMGFLYPALNQLFAHAARFRNRSSGKYNIQMVLRMPYSGGIHPPEHHSESYEALLLNTPRIKVVVPSTPYDAKGLLISSIKDEDPVVFLEPKMLECKDGIVKNLSNGIDFLMKYWIRKNRAFNGRKRFYKIFSIISIILHSKKM